MTPRAVDLFAGAGGASVGIEAALGAPIAVAVDHDETAVAVHAANHPGTLHLHADVWTAVPREVGEAQDLDLLWASPDCTHFSRAKGDVPRSRGIRSLAWVVVRWAKQVRPRAIALENVREFQTWGPLDDTGRPCRRRAGETYDEWVAALERIGYRVESRILDASLYGAPTKRRRLFVVARCDGEPVRWPAPTHGVPGKPLVRRAAECIDWSLPCRSIFGRKRPLAEATLRRVAEGVRRYVLDAAEPFIVSVHDPVGTITSAGNHHAVASPSLVQMGYGERKGQRPRTFDLEAPLGTVVAGGAKHGLVAAFLAKHYGGVVGSDMQAITGRDHHSAVAAHLLKWYGTAVGQPVDEPLHTATTKARFGLVATFLRQHGVPCEGDVATVRIEGDTYAIADIGLRMLEPHELLRAQFGEYADRYDLSAARTKAEKIRLIGNSVCPHVARAIVEANLGAGVPVEEHQGELFHA